MGAEGHESALLRKVAAGMLSGALAAGICNPTDLVKTRMQVGVTLRHAVPCCAVLCRAAPSHLSRGAKLCQYAVLCWGFAAVSRS